MLPGGLGGHPGELCGGPEVPRRRHGPPERPWGASGGAYRGCPGGAPGDFRYFLVGWVGLGGGAIGSQLSN